MYIPLIVLYIIVAWGAPQLLTALVPSVRFRQIALASGSAVFLVACLAVTAKQLTYWQDHRRLFQHALAVTEDNWFAHGNIAVSLGQEGAIREYITDCCEL